MAAQVFTLQVSFLTLTEGGGAGALLHQLYSLSAKAPQKEKWPEWLTPTEWPEEGGLGGPS